MADLVIKDFESIVKLTAEFYVQKNWKQIGSCTRLSELKGDDLSI